MSKPKKKATQRVKSTQEVGPAPEAFREKGVFDFLPGFRQRLYVLMAFTFVLFANSIMNESALDDEIVLNKNQYVQNGTQGIGDILSHDAYSSYYESMQAGAQLSGGRYRPLSIVTFAIEEALFGFEVGDEVSFTQNGVDYSGTIQQSIFDEKEVLVNQELGERTLMRVNVSALDGYIGIYHARHFVNVLLYMLTIAILFYLLHFVFFPQFKDLAFLALLIFAVHPIHTEVVANVKSRDEIMSLLFIGLTFVYAFKWRENQKTRALLAACSCYFMALLSKEWGIVLVALVPIAFVVFQKERLSRALKASIPFVSVAGLYLLIRVNTVGLGSSQNQADILNDPYLFASGVERFATETAILLKYFALQVFPHPLSADYSFKTIEYRNLGSWDFWASVVFHLGLLVLMIRFFLKKHVLAFALAFYLGPLFLVSNYVFDIGATMGERLAFHSSFVFCIALAYLLLKSVQKLGEVKRQKLILLPLLVALLGLASFKTIDRNADWKNNTTLFIHDVEVVPTSILANGNAGKAYLELAEKEKPQSKQQKELLNKAEAHLQQALKLDSTYYSAYLNLGYVWYLRNNLEKAESFWIKAEQHFSRAGHPLFWKKYDQTLAAAYFNAGLVAAQKQEIEKARDNMQKAVQYDPRNVQYLEDLGGACYTLGDQKKALEVWTIALTIDPNKENCRAGYRAITGKEWGQ
ncbi:MAG: hypothetical protein A3D92_12240 [Bacteroidetes bacterium RIFCSPHIGHO2_02_FULL_44_7]|nr:MAG: hypothetical protein A3D92_12240 [Bacteroidetes bacterium RIFCSPHIGHO2_02_FULL_44_7]